MKVSGINLVEGRWMTGHRGGWMVDWRSGSSIVSPFILPPPPPINHCTASCCLCSKGFGRIPPDHFSACPHDTHCLSSPPPINFTARFLSFAAETHSHSTAIHTGASQTYFQYLNRKIAAIVFSENIFSSVLSSCGAWPNRQVKFSLGKAQIFRQL